MRVTQGGHDVPAEKIGVRFKRSLDQLGWFAKRASAFWVVDNSSSRKRSPLPILARGTLGCLNFLSDTAFPEMREALKRVPRAKSS
jgi:hypothetical protein